MLARVEVADATDLSTLRELGVEILDDRPGPGFVAVLADPQSWSAVSATGFRVQVVTTNLQEALDEHRLQLDTRPPADVTDAFFDDFRDYDEVDGHLDTLAAARPDLVTVLDVGTSLEGRAIRGLSITAADADAPVVLINATQHAREWISTMTGICVADELVTRADEPTIADLLASVRFVVVPIVNPDGYVYTWSDDRFWRKNRRDGIGVDLNRNFSVAWGGPGASGDPDAGNYHGTAAFSEPESAALRDLALSFEHVAVHVDLHSFGQLVLRPWSYTAEPPPAAGDLKLLGDDAAEILTQAYGVQYQSIPGVELYPASGTAPDWAYGELGAMGLTFELRPDEVEMFELGFVLHPSQIEEVCLETMGAIEYLGAWAADAAPGDPGDSGDPTGGSTTTGGDGSSTGVGDPSSTTTGQDSGTTADAGTGDGGSNTSGSSVPPQTTGNSAGDSTGDEGGEQTDAQGEGCSCRTTDEPPPGWLWLGAFALLRRRNR